MKKLINNTYFRLLFVMVLGLFTEEIIFRIINEADLLTFSTLRILVEVIIISGLLSFLINLCKHSIVKKILLGFVLFVGAFYSCFQLGFNSFIGVFASLNASSQLGAVVDYIKDFFDSFKYEYFLTLIPFVGYLGVLILFRKYKLDRASIKWTA